MWNGDFSPCLMSVPCIRPNDPLFQMIQSESVGPGARLHVLEHDVAAKSAHGCSLNAREGGVPVGPEEDPWSRKGFLLSNNCKLLHTAFSVVSEL